MFPLRGVDVSQPAEVAKEGGRKAWREWKEGRNEGEKGRKEGMKERRKEKHDRETLRVNVCESGIQEGGVGQARGCCGGHWEGGRSYGTQDTFHHA